MSFRLRIFLLVLVVAGSAIGATAWLTLSLASREATRVAEARDRHEAEIVDAIRLYGVLHGRWLGIDDVVAGLSEQTGLHIRVETRDGDVLTDSDNLEQQSAGPVQLLPSNVDPVPALDETIQIAAQKAGKAIEAKLAAPGADPRATRPIAVLRRPDLPADLFTTVPAGGDPSMRAMIQAAQYRAALISVRCMAEVGDWSPALTTDRPPYLDDERLKAEPRCVSDGIAAVRQDTTWRDEAWARMGDCELTGSGWDKCLILGFQQAVASPSVVPVEIFFGARQDQDLDVLQQPALLGAVALLLLAALGTAGIARRVSRPVRLLTGASLQLAAGRLDVRVPAHGQDELARLSGAFNAMAEALQRSEERQRRLIADVAHELRTPLSNLRGYLEGLADGVIEPSPELFASLHEETLLQRRILDDLQVLALAEAGELGYDPVPFDLSELTEMAATAHRVVAGHAGIEVVVDAPDPVEVCADPDRMRQVVGNLMSNAIRYTDAGGRVELQVSRDGPDAVLTVRDTGVGMNADEVARVFDRFWRADPARQRATGGSGLGLTIVRRIVADQGGDVTATSTPGLGTMFTVRLPAVTDIASILNHRPSPR
ncbi:two-component sensor histidine kinase [Actinoplanes philippinensis]|uniref:histidine kinase n=1 Tax=Actinoplanes philippinensis TaxID=35752 RepID=A0A1I2CWN2_9ACTN|nr:ATP-binding protein [Actinoplanes philippinensis]GIE74659.1 two-component sensor histidine kinase [Actinoplanes philippinensis]SFE72173.1 two-component system, OmpR family, sensor histidine kinase BaeS [Actinoplanes philippinensis]